jgi:hypothetical protein
MVGENLDKSRIAINQLLTGEAEDVYTFDYRLWSETAKGEEESASELSV